MLCCFFSFPVIAFSICFAQIIGILSTRIWKSYSFYADNYATGFYYRKHEQILVIQALMSLNKDKIVLLNSIISAIVAIIANIMLIPRFAIGLLFSLVVIRNCCFAYFSTIC